MKKSEIKLFFIFALLMATTIAISNFLVQFPLNHFGLETILTYGAFTYPVTFLITDLSNRSLGKICAKKIVYIGFLFGILLTLFFSINFSDLISIRIAIGSGLAFLTAQILDVHIFDGLRKKTWFVAPIVSSTIGSLVDTFLFFFIAFYNTGAPWISLAFGDFSVKILMALLMLIPFRLLLKRIKNFTEYTPKTSSI